MALGIGLSIALGMQSAASTATLSAVIVDVSTGFVQTNAGNNDIQVEV
jgi:hypothetical protein